MSVLATFPTWWGNASSCVKSGGLELAFLLVGVDPAMGKI